MSRQWRGDAVAMHAQAYQRLPLAPCPAERISQRRSCLRSAAAAAAQVSTLPVIEQHVTNVNVFGPVSGDDIARIIAAQQVPREHPAIERLGDGQ